MMETREVQMRYFTDCDGKEFYTNGPIEVNQRDGTIFCPNNSGIGGCPSEFVKGGVLAHPKFPITELTE